jgi:flavin reductase (DIM6/NTAB) family NADH-FMN oxidoreductase RutF
MAAEPQIDSAEFRYVLAHFCSGITIITSHDGTTPVGLTCQSFFSLSLDPPLVAFSVSRISTSYPVIRSVASLVINVLSYDQHEISNVFAKPGTDKWCGISWSPSAEHGHPVIDGVVASLECEISKEIECGDHLLIIARVLHLHAEQGRRPLLYFQGDYHQLEVVTTSGDTK